MLCVDKFLNKNSTESKKTVLNIQISPTCSEKNAHGHANTVQLQNNFCLSKAGSFHKPFGPQYAFPKEFAFVSQVQPSSP